jgi:hypothetical protein
MVSIANASPRDFPNRSAIYVRNAHEIPNITKHVVFFNGDSPLTAGECMEILTTKAYNYPGGDAPSAILGIKDVPGARGVAVDLSDVKTVVWTGVGIDVFIELASQHAADLRTFKHMLWNRIWTSESDSHMRDLQIHRHHTVVTAIRAIGQNSETSLITSLPPIYVIDDNSDTPSRCILDSNVLTAILPEVKYLEISFINKEQKRRKLEEIAREHAAEYRCSLPSMHTREKIGILETSLFPIVPERVVLSTNASFDLVDASRRRISMFVECLTHCILLLNDGRYAIDINGHFQVVHAPAPLPMPATQ